MKAILKSLKPQQVANILNGLQSLIVSKTCPIQLKGNTPIRPEPINVYIYCAKEKKGLLAYQPHLNRFIYSEQKVYVSREAAVKNSYNAKVVAKFTLNKVEEIKPKVKLGLLNTYSTYETQTLVINPLLDKSCLSYEELDLYLGNKVGFAWYIDNLVIFDKPKELSEFNQPRDSYGRVNWNAKDYYLAPLTKAPQNYMFIETEE